MTRAEELIKEFIEILSTEEESDSGRVFRPVYISSCRVLLSERIGEIIKELRQILNIKEK